jgi:prepilin-type N-terminal cleavage/methylation domain-containing protein
MRLTLPSYSSRGGFTLIEVLIVTFIVAVALGVATPSVRRSLDQMRIERTATVVAADLRLGPSMAARQRRPVRLEVDTVARTYTLKDRNSGALLLTRRLTTGEFHVSRMQSTNTDITFFPNGLASGPVTVTVFASSQRRVVTMTRSGQIRVTP